jgi:hypothetical protein
MSEYIYAVNSLHTDFSEFAVQAIITKTFPAHAFLGEEEVCVGVFVRFCGRRRCVCVCVSETRARVNIPTVVVCVCVYY